MKKEVFLATNLGRGGISTLVLTAENSFLQDSDRAVNTIARRKSPLTPGEIVYGVIRDSTTDSIIDEVIICAYSPECRIITGHGGSASALALLSFYRRFGFSETSETNLFQHSDSTTATLLANLLAQTKTETQAFTCLQALEKLKNSEEVDINKILANMRPRVLALAGAANTGKSSLLNRLCGYERVLVSEIAGTTLDAVRDYIDLGGYYTHIIDTAGFRLNSGTTEKEAIRRATEIMYTADVILLLFDSSRELTADDKQAVSTALSTGKQNIIPLLTKSDLSPCITPKQLQQLFSLPEPLQISSITGSGIDLLLQQITQSFLITD